MDLGLRLTYLEAMGIDAWIPRINLQGEALPNEKILMYPRVGDVPALEIFTTALDTVIEPHSEIDFNTLETFEDSYPENDIKNVVDTAPTESPQRPPMSIATEDDPSVRFTVRVISHDSGLTLIDLCHHKMGHQRSHEQLAEAILKALNGQGETTVNSFQWPMANNPRIDSRRSAAKSACRSFILSLLQRLPTQYTLMFGESADYFTESVDNHMIFDSSLTTILESRVNKSDIWQQLKTWKATWK